METETEILGEGIYTLYEKNTKPKLSISCINKVYYIKSSKYEVVN